MSISTAGIAFRGNKVLVARRKPGSSLGGRWEFPGGKAEFLEEPREALRREYLEEFNIEIEVAQEIAKADFSHNNTHYNLLAFHIEFDDQQLEMREHDEVAWKTIEEIRKIDLAESDQKLLKQIERYIKKKR
jgi:8-oxo-dGTP diphosphatase